MKSIIQSHRHGNSRFSRNSAGFTLIELVVVIVISITIAAFAVPNFQNMMNSYRLSSAATSIQGAVQATRYQAITGGCSYQLALTTTSQFYQVQAQQITGSPPACSTSTYTNVGNPVQWSTSSKISLSNNITYTFLPNGSVTISGSNPITLTLNGVWKQITVSGTGYATIVSQ